jgi:hypothetical protein
MMSPLLILQIGTDPTAWWLDGADYASLGAQLSQGAPVTVQIYAPLSGQLVVNPRSAGSVYLGPPEGGMGTHPSDDRLPGSPANLYVPTAGPGPGAGNPGYPLEPDTDVATLTQQIVTAMTDGTVLPVPVGSPTTGNGTVVLGGASLAFAVISLPKPAVPPPPTPRPGG